MRSHRIVSMSLILLGVLGASVFAQTFTPPDPQADAPRPLDPDVFAVRVLLGIGDNQIQTWSGNAKVDKGDVLGVEGLRFRANDRVTGKDSWEAHNLRIRNAFVRPPEMPPSAVPPPPVGGTSNTGAMFVPNGVLITLRAPSDATLTLTTTHGEITLPLTELANGTIVTRLDGRV